MNYLVLWITVIVLWIVISAIVIVSFIKSGKRLIKVGGGFAEKCADAMGKEIEESCYTTEAKKYEGAIARPIAKVLRETLLRKHRIYAKAEYKQAKVEEIWDGWEKLSLEKHYNENFS
jgi:hypothetical protein